MMIKVKKITKGFSLIEVLVAILILAVGLLAILSIFAVSSKIIRISRNITSATELAQGVIDEEMNKTYDNLSIGTSEKIRFSSDENNPYFNFYKEIKIKYLDTSLNESDTDAGLKVIIATIYYSEGAVEKNVSLSTIKSKK